MDNDKTVKDVFDYFAMRVTGAKDAPLAHPNDLTRDIEKMRLQIDVNAQEETYKRVFSTIFEKLGTLDGVSLGRSISYKKSSGEPCDKDKAVTGEFLATLTYRKPGTLEKHCLTLKITKLGFEIKETDIYNAIQTGRSSVSADSPFTMFSRIADWTKKHFTAEQIAHIKKESAATNGQVDSTPLPEPRFKMKLK